MENLGPSVENAQPTLPPSEALSHSQEPAGGSIYDIAGDAEVTEMLTDFLKEDHDAITDSLEAFEGCEDGDPQKETQREATLVLLEDLEQKLMKNPNINQETVNRALKRWRDLLKSTSDTPDTEGLN